MRRLAMNNSKKGLAFIFALVGTLMLLISLFLPYISATEEHAKEIDSGQTDFWGGNEKNISVFDLIKDHVEESKKDEITFNHGGAQVTMNQLTYRLVFFGFYGLLAGFAIFALILALAWKPAGALVLSLLSAALYFYLMRNSGDWNIMFLKEYQRGIGFWLGWAGYALLEIGSVWMMIRKSALKKVSER